MLEAELFIGILLLALLGAAMAGVRWLLYGHSTPKQGDQIFLILRIGQCVFLLSAFCAVVLLATGVFIIPLSLLTVVVLSMWYFRSRSDQQSALAWGMAIALRRGLPLPATLRSLGRAVPHRLSDGAERIAHDLEQGTTLSTALARHRNVMPRATRLMAAAGEATDQLPAALREVVARESDLRPLWGQAAGRMLYMWLLVIFGASILSFLVISVIPSFQRILTDFDMESPRITAWVVGILQQIGDVLVLAIFMKLVVLGLLFYIVFLYVTGNRFISPPALFGGNFHADSALRALALAAKTESDFSTMFDVLSKNHGSAATGRRLRKVADRMARGEPWSEALRAERIINARDQAVLQAAERAGNLSWALHEVADAAQRRLVRRLQMFMAIAFPLAVVVFGVLVMLICLSVLLPLVQMISSLA